MIAQRRGNGRGAIRGSFSPHAALLVAAPGVAALLLLALFGQLSWSAALIALALVLAGSALIVGRHLAHIERLRQSVEIFGREGPEAFGALRRIDDSLLSPGLETALIEAAEERQERRRELESAMASNEAVLASLPDPLIMLNEKRRVVRVNPAARELFDHPLSGRDVTDVLRAPALLEAVDAVLAGAGHRLVEFTIPGAVHRTYQARVARLPSTALDGTVALLSLHDMTAVKRTEQLRADFVANASHELRTPLSSLLGFIETLRGPARDDEEARHRFLGIMHDQALRMTHLVEDLLSLSRIEMKEHSAPTGQADLARLLQSVAGGLELRAKEKDMRVEVEARDAPTVVGDFDELAQVFQNLIDNAIKYGRAGTPVQVFLGDPEAARRRLGRPAVAVCVRDRGEGIAREHLPRLTERFYRVDKARSRQLGGTGLGLAIVKHIVNRHRGALEVASVEGEGTTFTVHLPLREERASAPGEAAPEAPPTASPKAPPAGRDAAAE